MKATNPLFTYDLKGRLLIEASAGTGKTWTICSIVLRLLLENVADIDQMVIVTFTRAATAEMRERIHARLIETLPALSEKIPQDPFIAQLIVHLESQSISREMAQQRLIRAIGDFDQILISTIHGFCRQLLKDHALSSFMPFSMDVQEDSLEHLTAIAADFWRHHLLIPETEDPATRLFFEKFSQIAADFLPDKLARQYGPFIYKPYLDLPIEKTSDWKAAFTQYEQTVSDGKAIWIEYKSVITDLLISRFHKALKANYYKKNIVESLLEQVERFFNSKTLATTLPKHFERLGITFIESQWETEDPIAHQAVWITFDEIIHAAEKLDKAFEYQIQQLMMDFILYARDACEKKRHDEGLFTHDDVLTLTQAALQENPSFLITVQEKYPVLIVDESQDVDPIQADIFDQLYVEGLSFFVNVGDPKQAIYSFRGGDVHTYLKTRQQVIQNHQTYRLSTNFRSTTEVMEGINALFSAKHAFFTDSIEYVKSEAHSTTDHWVVEKEPLSGMQVTLLMPSEGKPWTKTELQKKIVTAVTDDIARLLHLSQKGKAYFQTESKGSKEPLSGKHIAVLVRTQEEGKQIQKALELRQIACVIQTDESIFQTDEARQLLHLLNALRQPTLNTVSTALATDFFGLSGNDLFDILHQETQLGRRLEAFRLYHDIWNHYGMVAALSRCLHENGCYRHLMNLPRAERRLTNTRHIIECLQKLETQYRGVEAAYQAYLKALIDDTSLSSQEDRQLRLESEAHLVQIMTIHKSKGLQFDIVFCPFLCFPKSQRSRSRFVPMSYHDEENNLQLAWGIDELEDALKSAQTEAFAEELRIAYVALTRAKYACYVVSGWLKGVEQSPLGWLVHQTPSMTENIVTKERFLSDWEILAKSSEGAICCHIRDEALSLPAKAHIQTDLFSLSTFPGVKARTFKQHLPPPKQFYDFTRLNGHEELTYGSLGFSSSLPETSEAIYLLPEGKIIGQCLHEILEISMNDTIPLEEIEKRTTAYDLDSKWVPTIIEMIRCVKETPLMGQDTFCLKDIPATKKLQELRFRFPLKHCGKEKLLQITTAFNETIHLSEDTPSQLDGMMNGIIDLIIEVSGRFYLIDYKTHHLGNHPDDYAPSKLTDVIDTQGYRLQYLIYMVALHRWLSLRLPHYHYDDHMGGVFYLFTRGMSPNYPAGNGVFYHLPAKKLIEALDNCLHGIDEEE